jgi:hypothetical protein
MSRRQYAILESASLAVRYNFSLPPSSRAEAEELQRTIAHERQHLFQNVATSYGFYHRSIRDLQSRLILEMIRSLQLNHHRRITYPLGRFALKLRPREKYDDVLDNLRGWRMLEFIRLYFEGDFLKWTVPSMGEFHLQTGGSITDAIARVDRNLSALFRERGVLSHYVPMSGRADSGDENERPFFLMKATSDIHTNVHSILESSATVAELWKGKYDSLKSVKANRPEGRYWTYLNEATRKLSHLSFPEFVGTYSALADLALNGALLPQHASVRIPGSSALNMHPAYRLIQGLASVSRVGPMKSLGDYSRFTEDVCQLNGWPSLSETVSSALEQMGTPETYPEDVLFSISLRTRKEHPYAFLSHLTWTTDWPDREAQTYLTHPVAEFTNAKLFHFNQSFVESMMLGYVIDTYARRLLLTKDRTVQLPYSASNEAVAYLTELTNSYWQRSGVTAPNVVITSGSRAAHQDSA